MEFASENSPACVEARLDRSVKTYDIFAEIFLDTFILVNNDWHNMSVFKKDFGYGGERLKSCSSQPLRLSGINRRANFASAGRRIGKSKARPDQMRTHRAKH